MNGYEDQAALDWRELVDRYAAASLLLRFSARRQVLVRLAHAADPLNRVELINALAQIVAICEEVTGEAADPDACENAVHSVPRALVWMSEPRTSHDWYRLGDYCAHWLRDAVAALWETLAPMEVPRHPADAISDFRGALAEIRGDGDA